MCCRYPLPPSSLKINLNITLPLIIINVKYLTQTLINETNTSSNAYATATDVLLRWPDGFENILIDLQELNVNSITFKIEGSQTLAFTDVEELKAATVLDDAGTYETLSDPWLYIRVRVLSTVGAAHGSLQVIMSGW